MKRNKGMMRSSHVKPSHVAWCNCASTPAGTPPRNTANVRLAASAPPTIQNMSKPRRASMDRTRWLADAA